MVGEGGDAFDAVDFARQLQPRVTLLGIRIEGNAFSATREIRQVSPRTKIIFLTMYDDLDYLTEAMESGASGYLLKTVDIDEVIAAIRAVDRGDSCIDRAMMAELVSESMSTVPRERRWILFASLTPIEREVLRFRAEGFRAAQISQLLGIDAASRVGA